MITLTVQSKIYRAIFHVNITEDAPKFSLLTTLEKYVIRKVLIPHGYDTTKIPPLDMEMYHIDELDEPNKYSLKTVSLTELSVRFNDFLDTYVISLVTYGIR